MTNRRLTGALASISGKMLALQSRIAKFAAAFIADHHAPVRPASRLVRAEFHGHFAMRRGARLHLLRDELDHEAESGKGSAQFGSDVLPGRCALGSRGPPREGVELERDFLAALS